MLGSPGAVPSASTGGRGRESTRPPRAAETSALAGSIVVWATPRDPLDEEEARSIRALGARLSSPWAEGRVSGRGTVPALGCRPTAGGGAVRTDSSQTNSALPTPWAHLAPSGAWGAREEA